MTFEEQMDIIIEQWGRCPIPEDFLTTEHNRNMCSVEGIQKQLDALPSGPGIVLAAVAVENSSDIEIKQFNIFKQ
jgi:hypothetical protein